MLCKLCFLKCVNECVNDCFMMDKIHKECPNCPKLKADVKSSNLTVDSLQQKVISLELAMQVNKDIFDKERKCQTFVNKLLKLTK